MRGKYTSWPRFALAYVYRQRLRRRLARIVSWPPEGPLRGGCTAVVGMCHRLPHVLLGNLRCLDAHAWGTLRHVIIVVDGVRGCLPAGLEEAAAKACTNLDLRFEYYSVEQARLSEELQLPYVFAWLSWSIGLGLCETEHAILHDYDALILDDSLARRYASFASSGAAVQGIRWYEGNGVRSADRLATTFEAFLDVRWVRSFAPIAMFHQIGIEAGHSRDYDILLDMQHRFTPLERRTIVPMEEAALVHPSQMIHQYTMLRRHPEKPLPCYSIPMIPFFELLSGNGDAIAVATARLRDRHGKVADFFGDGVRANFSQLTTASVDWALKQTLRVCLNQRMPPDRSLYAYGLELYAVADTPEGQVWVGDFTPEQRVWIDAARGEDASPRSSAG
jgi:hypothetical protein